jgi:hypothetical protein
VSRLPKQTSRRALIKRFRELGFEGPLIGTGDHPEFMSKGSLQVKIPNAHSQPSDIGEVLLKRILQNAGMSVDDWLGRR